MSVDPHNPRNHRNDCARLEAEDDVVIRTFCGTHVYNPQAPCTCGVDIAGASPVPKTENK